MIHKRERPGTLVALDDSHLPFLISTFRGRLDVEALLWHDAETNRIMCDRMRRGEPVVYITDARAMQVPSATLRKYWADEIKANEDVVKACLGIFVVLENSLMRGALTAVDWMTNQTRRVHYMPTMQDAVEEGNRRLESRGHPSVKLDALSYRV